jgi:type VI secretion system protein ImpB
MDGKSGAEELINKVLQNPALLGSLAARPANDTVTGPVAAQGDAHE